MTLCPRLQSHNLLTGLFFNFFNYQYSFLITEYFSRFKKRFNFRSHLRLHVDLEDSVVTTPPARRLIVTKCKSRIDLVDNYQLIQSSFKTVVLLVTNVQQEHVVQKKYNILNEIFILKTRQTLDLLTYLPHFDGCGCGLPKMDFKLTFSSIQLASIVLNK